MRWKRGYMMGKRILVVDDEPSIVKLVQFNLEKEGFRVDCALTDNRPGDGGAEPPDLMVLDLMLPKMDGLDVCRKLRKRECAHSHFDSDGEVGRI